jgi:formiminotetrahydrofolate cyclodeaminase
MLAKQPLIDVLDAFSSSAPTPGGGSAAALAGALGASLLAMVAALPKTRTNAPEERASLDAARAKLLALRAQLIDLIDRDAAAYDAVVAAYRLPKGTDEEKARRKTAIQGALKLASEVPLETCLAAHEVLNEGAAVAEAGNPSARTDVAVAFQFLTTASQGALFNIEANLGSVSDEAVVQDIVWRVKASAESMSGAMMRAYSSAGIMELFRQVATRFGLHHGHGRDDPPREIWIRASVETLKRLGSPDARRALEALSQSADEETARPAREALAAFTSRD